MHVFFALLSAHPASHRTASHKCRQLLLAVDDAAAAVVATPNCQTTAAAADTIAAAAAAAVAMCHSKLSDSRLAHCCVSTPLLLAICPARLSSYSVAFLSARAKALNVHSTMWWLFLPAN
jgi:hypothetical protein